MRSSSRSALKAAVLRHSTWKTRADLLSIRHLVIDERSSPELYFPADNTDAAARQIFGSEPYWPFVWAGGYAVSRHLIEQSSVLFAQPGTTLLDLGCGGGVCGLTAFAACAAKQLPMPRVIFNDIDEAALVAARLNLQETARAQQLSPDIPVKHALFEQRSLLGIQDRDTLQQILMPPSSSPSSDASSLVVACGDVMYSSEMGREILRTLQRLLRLPLPGRVRVLVGDPGRHAFKELIGRPSPQPSSSSSTSGIDKNFLESLGLKCTVVGAYHPSPPTQPGRLDNSKAHSNGDDRGDIEELTIEGLDGFEAAVEGGEVQVVSIELR